jgi:hypothetical protein
MPNAWKKLAAPGQAPGKRQNRPFKVLELDFSDYPTNRDLEGSEV